MNPKSSLSFICSGSEEEENRVFLGRGRRRRRGVGGTEEAEQEAPQLPQAVRRRELLGELQWRRIFACQLHVLGFFVQR